MHNEECPLVILINENNDNINMLLHIFKFKVGKNGTKVQDIIRLMGPKVHQGGVKMLVS